MNARPFPTSQTFERFALVAVCAFAVCVSLGAAMVSLSKVFVLLAVLGRLVIDGKSGTIKWLKQAPWTVWAVFLALAWMMVSFLWTEAPLPEAIAAMLRHSRLMWLVAVLYLLRSQTQAYTALKWVVIGQVFVVICSWLMWLGVHVPWAKNDFPAKMGILFTSTLEQPVMSTLMLLLLWFSRSQWPAGWLKVCLWIIMLLTLVNVLFIMTGRTGFLVMLLLISMVVFWQVPKRIRWGIWALPLLLGMSLYAISPRFQTRTMEIKHDISLYQQGKADTSQGERLDYWYRSLLAMTEKPILGHGVGSWKANYVRLGGYQKDPPSNPHQQYFLWSVEAGAIGLLMMLGIFFSLYRDALNLPVMASRALICTTSIAALMGLMNCPFYGVGMGEFFLVMMGGLLAFLKYGDDTNSIKKNI